MKYFVKIFGILLNILMTLIIITGIAFVGLYLFKIVPYVVESGSMEPTIETGSLSFIDKKVKYEDIKENDIIAFRIKTDSQNIQRGARVMHRVIEITDEGFVTKGDANENSDGITTNKDNYEGKTIFSIPKIGYLVKKIQTTKGKIILVTFIVVLFVAAGLVGKKSKEI